ncbi:unnamed protein product [Ambrosiozyma monospora]|uniref:Unnamed protein product n=1 Tax=Ambrosiozyma monospora TaxID=43982 RepID=A0ACB5TYF7_AMBMO|nr:unnamed protein product [Ambrosiozyma monospora]
MHYDAILTGYIHGHESLKATGEICIDVKRKNPNTLWVLDPVMGDEGQLYVSKSVIPVYREILKSGKVDVITPNQFELELLCDQEIYDKKSLHSAFRRVHKECNVKHIVVSSLNLTAEELGFQSDNENSIYCCISSVDLPYPVIFEVQKLNSYFTGVGDLFSALLLDRMFKTKGDIISSTNQVLSVMSKVLFVTRHFAYTNNVGKCVQGRMGDPTTMKECELRIVECREFYSDCDEYFSPIMI